MSVQMQAQDLVVAYESEFTLKIPSLSTSFSVLGVLGHNGAGKSTLLKTILGLLTPRTGSFSISTHCGDRLVPEQHMAFCPETGAVFEDITVEEYVRLWCRLKHRHATFYRGAGKRYLDLLELEPLLKKKGRELSKGQRRRVQTAIGFLILPRLFLFDEPFDGLDVQKTEELARIIDSHRGEISFIISSHRMDVMERLADRALVLREGAIAALGTIEETCRDLSGTRVLIEGASQPALLADALHRNLTDVSITRVGTAVAVTGRKIDTVLLNRMIKEIDKNGASLSVSLPSLTDAMSFHLREVQAR